MQLKHTKSRLNACFFYFTKTYITKTISTIVNLFIKKYLILSSDSSLLRNFCSSSSSWIISKKELVIDVLSKGIYP